MPYIFLKLCWTCTKDLSLYFFHLSPLLPYTSWGQTVEIWGEKGKMPEGKWEAGTWLPLGQITSRLNAFGGLITKYSTCSISKSCPERLYISWNFTWLKIIIPRELFFFHTEYIMCFSLELHIPSSRLWISTGERSILRKINFVKEARDGDASRCKGNICREFPTGEGGWNLSHVYVADLGNGIGMQVEAGLSVLYARVN